MTKRSIQNDIEDVSDTVLGDLSTEQRVQLFIKEAAANRQDRIERLADSAPRKKYTATDLEYTEGIKEVYVLSLLARHQLQQNYQAIDQHEVTRDKQMALMMVNELLSRLSRGGFEIDEFGAIGAPDHDDAEYAYGRKSSPDTACLATKYRELWEDLPAELLLDEADRALEYFPDLAAGGLMAYRTDLSDEALDDLETDRDSSAVYLSELRLLNSVVDFYINFHGWRLFAKEFLGVTLDELLGVSVPEDGDDVSGRSFVLAIDEQLCQNVLSLKQDYLEAYPSLLEKWADDLGHSDEEMTPDLDVRAEEYAAGLAEDADLPM
jgi:hypothetical protein